MSDERFIKIQKILAMSDIHSADCIKINDLIIELSKENQELNKKYLNAVSDYEQEKFNVEQLKKQLEEERNKVREYSYKLSNFSCEETYENQQKEFIEYMKKTIEKLECDDVDDEDLKGYLLQRIDTFKEILSKYKEINHIADIDKMVGGNKNE